MRPSLTFIDHQVSAMPGTYTSYKQPLAAYINNTTRIDISGLTDKADYTSITDGFQTVDFIVGGPLQRRTVPTSWLTWSSPPESESATPDVLWSQAHLFTGMTFSTPVSAVGFELEGDILGTSENWLVEYYVDAYNLLGFIVRTVAADAGARLFSFSVNAPRKITRVDISGMGNPFAIAQIRYSLNPLPDAPPPPPQVTPVTIDIMPLTSPNDIQRSKKGKLPVAVLSESGFDATTIDIASITLGDDTGTDTPVAKQNKNTFMAAHKDVDGDGDLDLVLQFDVQALVSNGDLTASTTQLVLKGTAGGNAVRGADAVAVK
jgi:hypothetical protein